jgi:CRP-like cAMP-binding protein
MAAGQLGPYGRNRLLSALAPADLARISAHLKNVSHPLGNRLHETGDPVETIYFPQSGMISLLAVMEDGKAVEMATVGREGAVGVMAAMIGIKATGRAVVQLEGAFSQISVAHFRDAVRQNAGIRDLVRRYSDAHMALIYQVAGCNALHPVARRLCRWILQTRDRSDSDVFPMTQEFLSEMLGVQRTSVSLLAGKLQGLRLIRYRRGQIQILDRRGLEEKACECYSAAQHKIDAVFSAAGGNGVAVLSGQPSRKANGTRSVGSEPII